MKKETEKIIINIVRQELIAALGCTEPIAVAYASAKAREVLGEIPDRVIVSCSGNIIKNVKGVIVPTTEDMKGISAASAVGITGGDPSLELEVLTNVNEETLAQAKELLSKNVFTEKVLHTNAKLMITVEMFAGEHRSLVTIIHTHTGIVRIEKDDQILVDLPNNEDDEELVDYSALSLDSVYEFANTFNIKDLEDVLSRQKNYNVAIGREGISGKYGAAVGKTLLEMYGEENAEVKATAYAAAGSDARMSGCEMPVVINSGSGNQGITVSVPVVIYGEHLGKSEEEIYRALCFANLVAIYQKSKIGRLSAFCGAINAATGAGAGIAYLLGMSLSEIKEVIINSIGGVSGVVCDGAKPSCAAKIACGLQAAFMAIHMVQNNRGFKNGEGLVSSDAEATLSNIFALAKDGMQITDEVILDLMVPSVKNI